MSTRYLLRVIAVAVFAFPGVLAAEPTQADIERLIVGKWNSEERADEGCTVHIVTEFQKDGALLSQVTETQNGQSITIMITGRWEVSGTSITGIVETSTPPTIPAGAKVTDEVLEINDKMCRLRKSDGKERTLTRIAS